MILRVCLVLVLVVVYFAIGILLRQLVYYHDRRVKFTYYETGLNEDCVMFFWPLLVPLGGVNILSKMLAHKVTEHYKD